MSGCISLVRSLLSTLLVLILFIIVLVGIPLSAISQVVTNRESMKSIVAQEEILSTVLNTGIDVITQNIEQSDTGAEISFEFTDPESDFRQQIEDLISTDTLEEGLITVIDAFYDWFEGKVDTPEFSIQLTEDAEGLAELLTQGMKEKLEELPECVEGQESIDTDNPLDLECIPADFDIDSIDDLFSENEDGPELDNLLDSATLSSDMLNITPKITEDVQLIFSILEMMPIIISAMYVALVLILLALISKVSRTFTIAGVTTLIPSILLFISSISSGRIIQATQNYADQRLPYEIVEFSDTIFTVVRSAADQLFEKIKLFSIIGMSAGAVLLILGIIFTIIYKKKVAARSPSIRRPGEDL